MVEMAFKMWRVKLYSLRLLGRSLQITVVLCFGLLTLTNEASAQASTAVASNTCPAEWGDYVTEIETHIKGHTLLEPIIFSDRDGTVYNCLDMNLDVDFLRRAEIAQKILPYDRKSDLGKDPSKWPNNICSISRTTFGILKFTVVNLPSDERILSMPACLNAIRTSRVLQAIKL